MVLAVVCYVLGRFSKPGRDVTMSLAVTATFVGALAVNFLPGSFAWEGFCGLGLHLSADGFRGVYATVAAFMWMLTGWFSPEYFGHYHNRNRYYFFNLMTLGATVGVFLSDDLYTTLIFFEIMSLTSYVWVGRCAACRSDLSGCGGDRRSDHADGPVPALQGAGHAVL